MKPKAAFRFIGQACPGYVTGPFLALLQENGALLLLVVVVAVVCVCTNP